ncbi:hypothetical protein E2C01_045943 [Portunus trituberculatus]|uniref:Uncharacterized protein n=1 Tax=Portunus trituberculatus TaxID=210409 RepID=A0A5B7FZL4_PORTR|nr:hypothetical protein [Portunus trituberculatus]
MGQDAGVKVSRKATDAGQKLAYFSSTLSKTCTILCRGVRIEGAARGGLVAVQGLHVAYCHLQDVSCDLVRCGGAEWGTAVWGGAGGSGKHHLPPIPFNRCFNGAPHSPSPPLTCPHYFTPRPPIVKGYSVMVEGVELHISTGAAIVNVWAASAMDAFLKHH